MKRRDVLTGVVPAIGMALMSPGNIEGSQGDGITYVLAPNTGIGYTGDSTIFQLSMIVQSSDGLSDGFVFSFPFLTEEPGLRALVLEQLNQVLAVHGRVVRPQDRVRFWFWTLSRL
jgi:hypothetical protein